MALRPRRRGRRLEGTKSRPTRPPACLLGKRYVNVDETLEILCTKAGDGSLGVGGELLSP